MSCWRAFPVAQTHAPSVLLSSHCVHSPTPFGNHPCHSIDKRYALVFALVFFLFIFSEQSVQVYNNNDRCYWRLLWNCHVHINTDLFISIHRHDHFSSFDETFHPSNRINFNSHFFDCPHQVHCYHMSKGCIDVHLPHSNGIPPTPPFFTFLHQPSNCFYRWCCFPAPKLSVMTQPLTLTLPCYCVRCHLVNHLSRTNWQFNHPICVGDSIIWLIQFRYNHPLRFFPNPLVNAIFTCR